MRYDILAILKRKQSTKIKRKCAPASGCLLICAFPAHQQVHVESYCSLAQALGLRLEMAQPKERRNIILIEPLLKDEAPLPENA